MALRLCIPDHTWDTADDTNAQTVESKQSHAKKRFPVSAICFIAPLALLPFFYPTASSKQLGVTQSQFSNPVISLKAAKAINSNGFIKVYGLASNTSHKSYHNVEALVQLQNRNGKALHMESALLPGTTFRSGSKSAFRVDMPAITGAYRCVVHFKTVSGKWLG